MIVRETRKIDSKGRVILPAFIVKTLKLDGAEVYFDITTAGHVMIKKVEKREKTPSTPDIEVSYNLLEPEKE